MVLARYFNKTVTVLSTVLIILFLTSCNATTNSITRPKELNTDRPGSDIETIMLKNAKPQLCSDACNSNTNCVAWTYVKPGILGPNAGCRLKDKISDPVRSSCCISGMK